MQGIQAMVQGQRLILMTLEVFPSLFSLMSQSNLNTITHRSSYVVSEEELLRPNYRVYSSAWFFLLNKKGDGRGHRVLPPRALQPGGRVESPGQWKGWVFRRVGGQTIHLFGKAESRVWMASIDEDLAFSNFRNNFSLFLPWVVEMAPRVIPPTMLPFAALVHALLGFSPSDKGCTLTQVNQKTCSLSYLISHDPSIKLCNSISNYPTQIAYDSSSRSGGTASFLGNGYGAMALICPKVAGICPRAKAVP